MRNVVHGETKQNVGAFGHSGLGLQQGVCATISPPSDLGDADVDERFEFFLKFSRNKESPNSHEIVWVQNEYDLAFGLFSFKPN